MESHTQDEFKRQVSLIKTIFPQVPVKVIETDLRVTSNVEETITRIVDGVLHYVPETIPNSQSSSSSPANFTTANQSSSQKHNGDVESFDTAAKCFGKTPCERMCSLGERKKTLIEAARQRYIKKHGLTEAE